MGFIKSFSKRHRFLGFLVKRACFPGLEGLVQYLDGSVFRFDVLPLADDSVGKAWFCTFMFRGPRSDDSIAKQGLG